jgi:hypothetical protein
MPRKPIDYSNTIIYKLVCRNLEIKSCYVGHTTDFPNRKRGHKLSCDGIKRQQYVHLFINENGGWQNWDMIMVEKFQCKDVYEASARERFYIEQLNADLNKYSPATGLSKSEYDKQYYIENADKIKEAKKQYYIENKDKIVEYEKQHYIENADKIKEAKKQYYTEHAAKIKDYNSTRFCCIICRKEFSRCSLNRHYNLKHNND